MSWRSAGIFLCLIMGTAVSAFAQETTDYTYDAKGRVTNVVRTGGPSNGVTSIYTYDRADNRTNVAVSGSVNGAPGNGADGVSSNTTVFVIVPLNGFTVIPIN